MKQSNINNRNSSVSNLFPIFPEDNSRMNQNPQKFLSKPSDEREEFQKKEEKYIKNIEFLKGKFEEVLQENIELNRIVRNLQDGGVQLHRETVELERQIGYLLEENERLTHLNQNSQVYKEIEDFNEEKAQCQAKIDQLHEKLALIFEDNDKLSSILREREEDFEKMQKIYEREMRLRMDIQKKYEELLEEKGIESNSSNENIKEIIEENHRLRDLVNEQERISKDFEVKVEILIQENEKLNRIFQQKSEQMMYSNDARGELQNNNQSLNEDNLKLTEILTIKMRELEDLKESNETLERYREKDGQNEKIMLDLEKKVEILLVENEKLHGILEEKLKDHDIYSGIQEKLKVIIDEKNKLQMMLNKKNEAELYWKKKFEEIEGKIKILFFQTNNHNI